jgi:hypothetical protein
MSIAGDAGYDAYKEALKSTTVIPGVIAIEALSPTLISQSQVAGVGDVNSKEKGSGARYNAGKPDSFCVHPAAFGGVAARRRTGP